MTVTRVILQRVIGAIVGFIAAVTISYCAHGQVPQAASPYERTLIREAHAKNGLNAPIAVYAGQIEQESAWKEKVCSAYACGLAQFTPATSRWISGAYPAQLGSNQPFNPEWAIRALIYYDTGLYNQMPGSPEPCDRWAFALSAYNGGPGWIRRDQALCEDADGCDPLRWWGNVELHTPRAPTAAKENRGYPRRILLQLQSHYAAWGGVIACKGG